MRGHRPSRRRCWLCHSVSRPGHASLLVNLVRATHDLPAKLTVVGPKVEGPKVDGPYVAVGKRIAQEVGDRIVMNAGARCWSRHP